MQILILCFSFWVSLPANAIQLNDHAVYHFTASGNTDTIELRVSQIEGDLFYTETTEDGSSPSRSRASISNYNLTMNQILTRCEIVGGTLEMVSTPAGTFRTCHTSYPDSDHYMSPAVPFAMVKMFYHSGQVRSVIELQSFEVHSFSHASSN